MKENSLQVLNEIKDKAVCVFNWFSTNCFKLALKQLAENQLKTKDSPLVYFIVDFY